ncbi:MAG: hypothetical protein ACREMW_05255 [Gemmatimonadales bacterium]
MRRSHGEMFGSSMWAGVIVTLLVTGCTTSEGLVDPVGELRLDALTETSLTGTVGTNVAPAPTVRVTTVAGGPAPGIQIRFEVSGRGAVGIASARTDRDGTATTGVWVLGPAAGAQTVTARSAGLADVVFTATAEHAPAAVITPLSGDNQTGFAGAALSNPLRARVADRFGNAVPLTPVTFVVLSGNGSMDDSAVLTDTLGIATSGGWTLGDTPGVQQVRAQSGDLQAVFTAFACDPACREELVFVRGEQIYTFVNGDARQLTYSGRSGAPAWSPNGQRIAFARYDQGWSIHLMDADGSNAVLGADGFHSPAWSPDGRLLAVATGGWYDGDIYLLSVDEIGTAPVHIASMAAQPAWSPDGAKIAFVSLSGDDGYHALHVMNADGSGVTALTLVDEGGIDHPSWSPDGRRIAFAKCIQGACNIVAVNADGSAAVQQLTTVHSSLAFDPAWSPDGTRIAFTLSASGGQSIAYISADGGEPILLTSGHSPAWRP